MDGGLLNNQTRRFPLKKLDFEGVGLVSCIDKDCWAFLSCLLNDTEWYMFSLNTVFVGLVRIKA